MIDIKTHNLSNKECLYSICAGYWLTDFRIDQTGQKQPLNPEKIEDIFLHSLQVIKSGLEEQSVLIILNDASPRSIEEKAFMEVWEDYPLILLNSHTNLGLGGKENLLQTISTKFSKYFFRLDIDVKIQDKSIMSLLRKAFEDIPNLGLAIVNAGFLGAMICGHKNCKEYPPVRGAVGNGIMIPTSVLREVGFSDPLLRYFDDVDLAFRIYEKGYQGVMVRDAKGSTISSGGGAFMDLQQACAHYLEYANPSIKVGYRKLTGKPIIYHRKSKEPNTLRYVPPSPLSFLALEKLSRKYEEGLVL